MQISAVQRINIQDIILGRTQEPMDMSPVVDPDAPSPYIEDLC